MFQTSLISTLIHLFSVMPDSMGSVQYGHIQGALPGKSNKLLKLLFFFLRSKSVVGFFTHFTE